MEGESRDLSAARRPNRVDALVGARLKKRRLMLGLTIPVLAERVGVSDSQISKYETGANRISASRLYELCEVLETPVSWFFADFDEIEGADVSGTSSRDQEATPLTERPRNDLGDWIEHDEDMKRIFERLKQIEDSNIRRKIISVIHELIKQFSCTASK